MIKTINFKYSKSIISRYKNQTLKRSKNKELEKAYEEYIYQGIMEAENQIKNGAKSYSHEEFVEIMRVKYGCII